MRNFEYFLLAAEELNFSRAAKRAFVSQQCLSTYIRKLEEEYNVQLFNRKPHLSLTPAGQLLYRRARQIELLENSVREELAEMKGTDFGTINIGISYGRAMSFALYVIPRFRELFPNVAVNVYFGITKPMAEELTKGKLTAFIGMATEENKMKGVKRVFLQSEGVKLAICEKLLKQYFPDEYPQCKLRFQENVDLNEFLHVPFIMNSKDNIIASKINSYLMENGINISPVITVEGNEIQIPLADQGACFAFNTLEPYLKTVNSSRPEDNQILTFPINGLEHLCDISLFYLDKPYFPNYERVFYELVKECYIHNKNDELTARFLATPKF